MYRRLSVPQGQQEGASGTKADFKVEAETRGINALHLRAILLASIGREGDDFYKAECHSVAELYSLLVATPGWEASLAAAIFRALFSSELS